MDTKPLCSDNLFQGLYLQTNKYFKLRIDKKNRREDKNRTLAGAYLLGKCLSDCGLNIERVEIYPGEGGKPMIKEFPFNISHSGELAACAIADGEVGVDVEKVKQVSGKILDKIALPTERARISAAKEIIRLWTRKEAFAKCLGTGIGEEIWKADLTGDVFVYRGKTYRLRTFVFGDYYVSVCTEDEFPPEQIEIIKPR